MTNKFTSLELLEILIARYNSEWDNPLLIKFKPLGTFHEDLDRLIKEAEKRINRRAQPAVKEGMAIDTKFNGWTNYETWNVALWFDNDSSEYWAGVAQETFENAKATSNFTREEEATFDLAKTMQGEVKENMPTTAGMYADLLNASLSSVNWQEIASHVLAEALY